MDRNKHQYYMTKILLDIFGNRELASLLANNKADAIYTTISSISRENTRNKCRFEYGVRTII